MSDRARGEATATVRMTAGGGASLRPQTRRTMLVTLAVTALALGVYLVRVPQVPDLAAQFARAAVAKESGFAVWYSGWFGGLHMPTYSELTPTLMAVLGAPATGALAVLVSIPAMAMLLRRSQRPLAGSLAFAASSVVDLLNGRITFAVGVAAGLWALWALSRRRPVLGAVLGVVTCLSSPLAAFFLGIAAVAAVVGDNKRRWEAAALGSAIAVTAAGLALLFPGTGEMPSPPIQVLPALPAAIAVALAVPRRVVRVGCAMISVVLLLTLVVPSSVGENVVRIIWVFAAPLVVAYAPLKRAPLAFLTFLLALWPIIDLGQQLSFTVRPSTYEAYYQPLLTELHAQTAVAGPSSTGQRIEVLDSATHGADRFVAAHFPLARGWDRQADRSDNALFYVDGALTPTSYQTWLGQLAVGWVAVPHDTLDYASEAEGRLVASGLPYLSKVWSSADWDLYRVQDAQPLVSGTATLVSSASDGVTFTSANAGDVYLQMRYSPYLVVKTGGAKGTVDQAVCVAKDGPWTRLRTPSAGTWTITADFKRPSFLAGSNPDATSCAAFQAAVEGK